MIILYINMFTLILYKIHPFKSNDVDNLQLIKYCVLWLLCMNIAFSSILSLSNYRSQFFYAINIRIVFFHFINLLTLKSLLPISELISRDKVLLIFTLYISELFSLYLLFLSQCFGRYISRPL